MSGQDGKARYDMFGELLSVGDIVVFSEPSKSGLVIGVVSGFVRNFTRINSVIVNRGKKPFMTTFGTVKRSFSIFKLDKAPKPYEAAINAHILNMT